MHRASLLPSPIWGHCLILAKTDEIQTEVESVTQTTHGIYITEHRRQEVVTAGDSAAPPLLISRCTQPLIFGIVGPISIAIDVNSVFIDVDIVGI